MTIPLGTQRLTSGVAALAAGVTADDTDLPLDTADWTSATGPTIDRFGNTIPSAYPILVEVGGELIQAAAATVNGTVTLTGCSRSLNGVRKAHGAGVAVRVAHPFRLGLGQATRIPEVGPGPSPPPAGPGAASVRSAQPSTFTTATNQWLVNYPTIVADGDVMLACLLASSPNARTFTPPAGWTAVAGSRTTFGTTGTIEFFTKDTVAAGDAGGSATWTVDADSAGVAHVAALADAGAIVVGTPATGTGLNPDPPALTTGFGNVPTLGLAYAAARDDGINFSAFPAGFTHRTEQINSGAGLAGWNEVFFDDFATVGTYDAGALGPNWTAFNSPGNAGFGLRRTTAVQVINDPTAAPPLNTSVQMEATWDGSNITSGIIHMTAINQTYGRYRFRVKSSGDPSNQLSPVVLLWPSNNIWPLSEIDVYEGINSRVTVTPLESFLHRANPITGQDEQIGLVWQPPAVPWTPIGTNWHTWELTWLPDVIYITVDDAISQTFTGDPAWIYDGDMVFSIQLDTWANGALSQNVQMWVDWVVVSEPVFHAGANLGVAAIRATATSVNPGPFTLAQSQEHYAVTVAVEPVGAVPPVAAEPTIPTFNSGSATTITPGQNVKTIIEAGGPGDHFLLAAGTHTNCENVLLQTNQHVRLATGCILEGTGKGYCFRPADSLVTGVAIGGDPAGARPIIRNYGQGSTTQGYAPIMGITDDRLGGQFIYTDVDDWFVYHLDLDRNAASGVQLGSNFTVYDCEIHGHLLTGIAGDRIVGGVIWGNLVYWNALNPATGVSSNGAQVKLTWCNADIGRTSQTPVDRTKAQVFISTNTFEALDRNAGPGDTDRGVWLDLDCQWVLVEHNTVDDHPNFGIFVEGCNANEVAYNTVRRTPGFGPAYDTDFRNAAICTGESTNTSVHDNTLIDCDWALMNRISNRSVDWLDPTGSVNYAYAAGPRYWILDTTTIPTGLPTPGQSNIWTANNSYVANTLINCGKVAINEGTDNPTQTTHGSTNPANITFTGNDYSASASIQFYDRSNTALTLAQWQALGRQ